MSSKDDETVRARSVLIEVGLDRGGAEGSSAGPNGGSTSDEESRSAQRREDPRPGSELASYWISSGERLLVCAMGKAGLEIFDVPADFLGESYRVERALDDEGALSALVDDYLTQARHLDAPPMSSEALAAKMLRRSED